MIKNKWVLFLTVGILLGLCFGVEAIPKVWLNDLEDCNVPSPNEGDVLTYNSSTTNWTSQAPVGGFVTHFLNNHIDVNIPSPSNNDVLTWDSGTSNWTSQAPSGGSLALNDLTDVDTSGVATDDFIKFNGTGWNDFDLFNTANTWLQTNTFNVDVDVGNDVNIANDLWVQKDIYLDSDSNILYLGETQQGNLMCDGTNIILTQRGRGDIMIIPSGIINFNQQSACRVILPMGGQVIPANAWTILNLQAVNYDNQGEWNIFGNFFLVSERGLYQIDYSVYLDYVSVTTMIQVGIFVNGVLSGGFQTMRIGVSCDFALSGADCLQLVPNDRVDLRVYQTEFPSTLAPSQTYTNYIAIHKLS